MPSNFIATFEFVAGSYSPTPYTGFRNSSKTTKSISILSNILDPLMPSSIPAGNAAVLLGNATGTDLLKPASPPSINYGNVLLQIIGGTLDQSVSILQTTGVPPTIAQVLGIYNGLAVSISTTSESQILNLAIPRYIAASFTGGEG
jgi:hypothetical protein